MPIYSTPDSTDDPLTKLLLMAAPLNKDGRPTITGLARIMKLTRWSIHKWIINQKLPPERVVELVRISEGRVKVEDFHPFVYKA